MKTILTAATAALIGFSVLTAGPAMAGHKGKGHKHFKGGISISIGHNWFKHHNPYWAEPDCYYQKVWVFSPKHGHKIQQLVLVCN